MWTLALETTSANGSVALLRDRETVAEIVLESRQYGSEIFAAVDRALAAAGCRLEDVDLFAVADGPGSFTGVRIGLTAVKGFVEVLGKPAVGVSSLRAVAGEGASVGKSPTLAALDASRGEVYYGLYPEAQEGLEPLAAFQERLRTSGVRGATPHPQLQALCPALELVSPILAPMVGRLGLDDYRAGRIQDALELDARYLRRSDAEMLFKPS